MFDINKVYHVTTITIYMAFDIKLLIVLVRSKSFCRHQKVFANCTTFFTGSTSPIIPYTTSQTTTNQNIFYSFGSSVRYKNVLTFKWE